MTLSCFPFFPFYSFPFYKYDFDYQTVLIKVKSKAILTYNKLPLSLNFANYSTVLKFLEI